MKQKISTVFFLIGFFLSAVSFAQEFNFSQLTLHDGLPNSQVNCLYQGEEGYIWIGTNEGIKKYAGKSFIDVYARNPVSLTRPIKSIAESDDYTWFATDRSVFKCIGNYTEEYPLYSRNNPISINKIIPVNDSDLYVLTSLGVWELKDRKFSQFYTNLKVDVENVTCGYLHQAENELWLGTASSGIYAFNTLDKTLIEKYQSLYDTLQNEKIQDIETYFDAKLFISVADKGVMQYNFHSTTWLDGPKPMWLASTSDIYVDKKGGIWFATFGNGLVKYNEKEYQCITEENGLADNKLLSVITDSYGNAWCGTASQGVSVLLNQNFLIYNMKQNLPANNCRQILPYEDNLFILCTSAGACFFDEKNISPFFDIKTENVTCADYNSKNRQVAIGKLFSNIDIYDGATGKSTQTISTNANILSVKFLSDTALLVGTDKQGLLLYSLKTKELSNFSARFHGLSIYCIATDGDLIWVGTDRGLYYIKDKQISKLIDKDNQLSESAIHSIACTPSYINASTDGFGVFRYNKNNKMFTQIERRQGLKSVFIKSVYATTDDELFVTSSNSLYKISFAPNQTKIDELIDNFSRNNAEFLPNSLVRGLSGTFYIGTSQGLVSYAPNRDQDILRGLIVKLTSIQLFNDTTNWVRLGYAFNAKANLPENLTLAYDQNNLTFGFEVFNALGNNKYMLKYKLEGFDKKWMYAEKTNKAIYSNLDNGKYIFYVAVSYDGINWSAPSEFAFEISPPFWKTNSFFIIALTLLFSVMVLFIRVFKSYKEELIRSTDTVFNLANARIILAGGSVLIIISGIVYAIATGIYDSILYFHIGAGVLLFTTMLFSFTSTYVKNHAKGVLTIMLYGISTMYLYLIYETSLAPYFLISIILVINIAHLILNKVKPFLIYGFFVLAMGLWVLLATSSPGYSPLMYIVTLISAVVLTLISIQVHLNLSDKLLFANSTINNGNALVLAANKEGEIIFASKNFEPLLGYTEKELLGNGWWQIRSGDTGHNQEVKDTIVAHTIERNQLERITDKRGVVHYIQWENSVINENIVVGMGIDVTEQKRLEEKYKHIVESASDVIYITDINGVFTYVNDVGTRFTGYTHDELLAMNMKQLLSPSHQQKVYDFNVNLLKNNIQEDYIEIPTLVKGGAERWLGLSVKLYKDDENTEKVIGFQVIGRDITDRIEAQRIIAEKNEHIRKHSERLEILNEIKQVVLEASTRTVLVEKVLNQLKTKVADAERITLTLFDEDIKTAHLHEFNTQTKKIEATIIPAVDYRSLPTLLQNKHYQINDLLDSGSLSNSDIQLLKPLGINSYVITPIFFEKKLVGALNLASTQSYIFDHDYVNFARQVADAIAVTLDKIDKKETIELQNTRIQSYSERLEVINSIKKEFINAKTVSELMDSVLRRLCTNIAQYKSTFVTFHNEQRKQLETFHYEMSSHSVKRNLQTEVAHFNFAAYNKKDYLLYSSATPAKIASVNSFPDEVIKANTRSFLSVAIRREQRITGTISVISSKPDTFSDQDIQLLTDLAESIQLGIEQITYRKELSEKNKDISDNIEYSLRIQQSIMPPESFMQAIIPASFVILKQRDVIGGDFYWCHKKDDKIFMALGDCTGHGVSGALLSILCGNIISQAVIERNFSDPGVILDFLNKRIKESLNQYKRNDDILDGLDVSLCVMDLKRKVLMFGGAMHSLYVVQGHELTEIKGNRIPIGGIASELKAHFTTEIRILSPDMKIYMSSDGYFDQFNGTSIKKYSKAQFKQTLIEMQSVPMDKRKNFLWKRHIEWKKKGNQTDDICVIGFCIKSVLEKKEELEIKK
ncbi:MAG: PAS domain S-box protein [Bacteroidetes bacterium]|nr:PAS domain S-box protein [Bacteroidota bacterium]